MVFNEDLILYLTILYMDDALTLEVNPRLAKKRKRRDNTAMITAEEGSRRWAANSLKAYLEGQKDLKWILGVLNGLSVDDIRAMLGLLDQYGLPERRLELNNWLMEQTLKNAPSPDEAIVEIKAKHAEGALLREKKDYSPEFSAWDTTTQNTIHDCFTKQAADEFAKIKDKDYRMTLEGKLGRLAELLNRLESVKR